MRSPLSDIEKHGIEARVCKTWPLISALMIQPSASPTPRYANPFGGLRLRGSDFKAGTSTSARTAGAPFNIIDSSEEA